MDQSSTVFSSSLPIVKNAMNGEQINTVDARSLHRELEVNKDFSDWIKSQIERAQLFKGEDFEVVPQKGENPLGGRPSIDYALTIDAAKNISMMSATEKGKQVRRYFIEAEKALRHNPTALMTRGDVARLLLESEQELAEARKVIETQAVDLSAANLEVAILKPDANYAKAVLLASNSMTTTEAAKRLGLPSAIELHKQAHEKGLIYCGPSGGWVPYSKYSAKDVYFSIRVHMHSTRSHGVMTKQSLTWTEAGIKLAASIGVGSLIDA